MTLALRTRIALAWLVALVVAHVGLRVLQPDLGPQPGQLILLYFFGLNLPSMALASSLPKDQKAWGLDFRKPPFLVGMIVVVAAFMTSAMGAGTGLGPLLTVLTAQALFLAFPLYWATRHLAAQPGRGEAVRRAE